MDDRKWPENPKPNHCWTIETLRLNIEAAQEGRTWLLLPEGFRDQDAGEQYPLPAKKRDLQILATIVTPRSKHDSGCRYLRRAREAWKQKNIRKMRADLYTESTYHRVGEANRKFKKGLKELEAEARKSVEEVKALAERETANLKDLFALGRQGIKGQMEAHLSGEEWQGEKITASAFRDCYRMVSQTVKALGIPSDQKHHATNAVMDEVAAALEDTKEALSLAPGGGDETEN